MDLRYERIDGDEAGIAALAEFLTGDEWPFHGDSRPTREAVAGWLANGRFSGPGTRNFWIRAGAGDGAAEPGDVRPDEVVGVVTLREIGDPTPLFDLRLRAARRGSGIGTAATGWLTAYLFTEFAHVMRIEGHTRRDNVAMQKVFERCGYVREAQHRQAWPSADGSVHDSLGYAILRQDWLSGGTTPFED